MLHITAVVEPHQLWLLIKFCHLSLPLLRAYPNRHIFLWVCILLLVYLYTYSMYKSLNPLHPLPGEVSRRECSVREGEAVFCWRKLLDGEEGAMFAMTGWFYLLLKNSSCTGGCYLFGSEFHFVRQSVVVGCCHFLRTFLQSSCTKRFACSESKAWDSQIWDASRFTLYLLNFSATNFLSVLALTPALIIPLRVIIRLELHPSNIFSVLLRVNQCLLFTSADFPQTRQAELPTRVIQHFAFIWNPCFASKERVWKRSLLASNDKSSWQSLLPFDSLWNSLWQGSVQEP